MPARKPGGAVHPRVIDQIARATISAHEELCADRWRQILARMTRMETVVISSAGAMIIALLGVVFTHMAWR